MILPRTEPHYTPPVDPFTFGDEITVFPLQTVRDLPLIWRLDLNPTQFNEKELKVISDFYWKLKAYTAADAFFFDFRNPDHLYELCERWGEFAGIGNSDSTRIQDLLDTFEFYREMANLDPILNDLLDLKLERKDNMKIR